jgi:D-xylonolactonase
MNQVYDVRTAVSCQCRLGESPLWDGATQTLLWADIVAGRVFRYNPRTGATDTVYSGEPVGGFTLEEDGSLLLFQVDSFARLAADGGHEVLRRDIDADMDRFNDVIADPRVRVFAGTIVNDDHTGGLFRIDCDGSVRCLFKGTGCANGMDFSPDLRFFYWTCSTTRVIFRFDYDPDSGEISGRTPFITLSETEGIPDGLTIDADGHLWSALWDGHAVAHFNDQGRLVEKIPMPVGRISSVAFGGAALDELYITSARRPEGNSEADGNLFHIKGSARGRLPYRSRIVPGSR